MDEPESELCQGPSFSSALMTNEFMTGVSKLNGI